MDTLTMNYDLTRNRLASGVIKEVMLTYGQRNVYLMNDRGESLKYYKNSSYNVFAAPLPRESTYRVTLYGGKV